MQQLDFDQCIWPINLQGKMFWSLCWCSVMNIYETKETSTHTRILYSSLVLMWKRSCKKNLWCWCCLPSLSFMSKWNKNNIEVWCSLRTVFLHFHAIWLTTEVILKFIAHIHPSMLAGLSHHRPSIMREDLLRESELLFFHVFFMPHTHCLANRSENRTHTNREFTTEKFPLETKLDL